MPESGEFVDVTDLPAANHPPTADGAAADYAVPDDMPLSTPPPVPEGLPVVSLQDIAVMEQKKGGRGIRVKSRRGSTTASHASLSAIPENVPLHPRSERSDSMRVAHAGQPLNRLADVQELEVPLCRLHRPQLYAFLSTNCLSICVHDSSSRLIMAEAYISRYMVGNALMHAWQQGCFSGNRTVQGRSTTVPGQFPICTMCLCVFMSPLKPSSCMYGESCMSQRDQSTAGEVISVLRRWRARVTQHPILARPMQTALDPHHLFSRLVMTPSCHHSL